jgi:hypothetical protein
MMVSGLAIMQNVVETVGDRGPKRPRNRASTWKSTWSLAKTDVLVYVQSMETLFFSTGKAALALAVTQERIRDLCSAGAIEAESTPGGQWRIGKAVVEGLKRDGLPSLPRPLPGDNPSSGPAKPRYGHSSLLAPPSDLAVNAVESVSIAEAALKRRRIEWELLGVEDQFTERERDEAERLAAEEQAELERQEAERRRQAREEAERERESWLASWERYALGCLPPDAPAEVRLLVHESVRVRLQRLQPIPGRDVTCKLTDALVEKALGPWRRRKEFERVIEEAVNRLPSEARSYFKPTAWQSKATQAAREAIRQVDRDASLPEIEEAARQAVEVTARQFEAHQAAQADTDLREHLVRWMTLPAGLPEHDKETAIQAVRQALAALPLGTSRPGLERAVEEALTPYRAAVAELQDQAQAEQRRNQDQAQAEQRRIQDRANRQSMIATLHRVVPLESGLALTPAARAAVAKAVNEPPEGASQRQLDEARDQALRPFLDAYNRQRRKEEIVASALQQVLPRLVELEASGRWDLEGETAADLARQFTPAIRKRLELELTGQEPPEAVARRVRQLVRKELENTPAVA